jgi:hypothetical protein
MWSFHHGKGVGISNRYFESIVMYSKLKNSKILKTLYLILEGLCLRVERGVKKTLMNCVSKHYRNKTKEA